MPRLASSVSSTVRQDRRRRISSVQMAPAALNYFVGRQFGINYQVTSAAAVLVALPVLIVYYVLQRRYGADVLAGSLKG